MERDSIEPKNEMRKEMKKKKKTTSITKRYTGDLNGNRDLSALKLIALYSKLSTAYQSRTN